ncbi:hypothetical protein MTO96_002515 [Rhipicephalus appendiculatus]
MGTRAACRYQSGDPKRRITPMSSGNPTSSRSKSAVSATTPLLFRTRSRPAPGYGGGGGRSAVDRVAVVGTASSSSKRRW